MMTMRRDACVGLLALAGWTSLWAAEARTPAGSAPASAWAAADRVPVIYSTDLLHRHDDPDDHFDLATLFAIDRLAVRAIVLDLGERQAERPGRVPVEQILALSGKRVPYATGLSVKLQSLADAGRGQPTRDQGGVELVLETLRQSPGPTVVITAGSLRDIYASFVRDPELVRHKVARLYINIGDADGGDEWNVTLDRNAYVGIMRSGLPIYWAPCKPFNDPRSTYWQFRHADVLETAPAGVQNFFIYALQVVPPDLIDPIAALRMDLRPWRYLVWGMTRQMWCTATFLHAAGATIEQTDSGRYVPRWPGQSVGRQSTGRPVEVFTFVPAHVDIDDTGKTRTVHGSPQAGQPAFRPNLQAFQITDSARYGRAMTDCLAWLLAHWPSSEAHGTRPGLSDR